MINGILFQNLIELYRKDVFNTFTLTLDFHVGPISTNGYSRSNLKVQKKQGT